jgi:hypothetical protein
MSLMDRFAAGLETLGKKANQALDEGKLRMELMRARRRMDSAARDLGYVTYRQAKGEQAPQGEIESLTRRISEAEAEAARLQAEITKLKAPKTEGGPGASDPASPPPSDQGPPSA